MQMAKNRGRQEHPTGPKITISPEERAHIRGLREGRNWTQQELADKAHTTQGTISNLESGDRQVYLSVYKRVLIALKAETTTSDYYSRIVDGASDLTETEQMAIATLIDAYRKAREQKP